MAIVNVQHTTQTEDGKPALKTVPKFDNHQDAKCDISIS